MPEIQYPAYLQEADKRELGRLVAEINAATQGVKFWKRQPVDIRIKVQAALDWLWQKKAIAGIKAIPKFPEGTFPRKSTELDRAWTYLKWKIANKYKDIKVAFEEFNQALEKQTKAIYGQACGEDEKTESGTAFFLAHPLSGDEERALFDFLQSLEESLIRTRYLITLIDVGTRRLQCCVELAKAGAKTNTLIQCSENLLLTQDTEACLVKIEALLALPSTSAAAKADKLAKVEHYKKQYLEEIAKLFPHEETRYVHKLRCYKKLLGSDLPLDYLAGILKDMRGVYLTSRCFEAVAETIFSVNSKDPKEAKDFAGLQCSLVIRLTDLIWMAVENHANREKLKLVWLQCVVRADKNSVMAKAYLREKLAGIPEFEGAQAGLVQPVAGAVSMGANGGAGAASSSISSTEASDAPAASP